MTRARLLVWVRLTNLDAKHTYVHVRLESLLKLYPLTSKLFPLLWDMAKKLHIRLA
jgi:hypothetical protein